MAKSPASPGRMVSRIRFDAWEEEVCGTDPGGGETLVWVPKFYRWAEIRKSDGSEQAIAQRLQSVVPARIFVRYDSQTRAVTSSWRVVEVETQSVVPDGGVNPEETTMREIRSWALKTVEDIEGDRAFITMQAVSGVADA